MLMPYSMANRFDDEWEDDFDNEIIEQCILVETLSQAATSSTNSRFGQTLYPRNKQTNYVCNRNVQTYKPTYAAARPLSGFSVKPTECNVEPLPKLFNNKLYNAIPIQDGKRRDWKLSEEKNYLPRNNTDLFTNSLQLQIDKIKTENEQFKQENFIKQGEVSNLRLELRRKDAVLASERLDHCSALEAAEKRGKEKVLKSLSESESKIKNLNAEVDKLNSNIAFKDRELDETLARCHYFQNLHSNKDPRHELPSPKRLKRDFDDKHSPRKSCNNFSDRFDFYDKRKSVRSVQIQTSSNVKLKRSRLGLFSKGGIAYGQRRALLVANNISESCSISENASLTEELVHSLTRINVCKMDQELQDIREAVVNDDEAAKHICQQLKMLLAKIIENSKCTSSDATSKIDFSWYTKSVIPLFNTLEVLSTNDEVIVHQTIYHVAQHLLPLPGWDDQLDSSCLINGLKALIKLGNSCSNISLSMRRTVIAAFKHCLQRLKDEKEGVLCTIQAITIFLRCEVIRYSICCNAVEQGEATACLVSRINETIMTGDDASEDFVRYVSALISQLLQSPAQWLSSTCICSMKLLSGYIKILYILMLKKDDKSWPLVLLGIRVLHHWQLVDSKWWERVNQVPHYALLIGEVVRKSKILKAHNQLNEHIEEHLYDLHWTEDIQI